MTLTQKCGETEDSLGAAETRSSDAVPAAVPDIDGIRALHVSLKLRDDQLALDRRIVGTLVYLRDFSHVIAVVPSIWDMPEAPRHPLVRAAVTLCQQQGIKVMWGRALWPAWPEDPTARAHSQFDPAYYATVIARVKEEARALGAVGTWLDGEPYADSPQNPLERHGITDRERAAMTAAISLGTYNAGYVDWIRPTCGRTPRGYQWPLTGLGEVRCNSETYYSVPPGYDVPEMEPPPGYDYRLDLWGCHVGLRPGETSNGKSLWTWQQVQDLDLTALRQRYPTCRGAWVYVHRRDLPAFLAAL